jgi:S1-C subfamily serine protease
MISSIIGSIMSRLLILLNFVLYSAFAQQSKEMKPNEIYSRSAPSVVLIKTQDAAGQPLSQGTGFIVSADGKIFTNYHVIRHAKSASVFLSNGDAYDSVDVIELDKRKDIALIRIKAVDLPSLQLGKSSELQPGERVYAITNPQGLQNSLSEGILSAVRQFEGYRLFQTTTPISHGSSGGPLFNSMGQVVGIAVGSFEQGQNLNLAIPIDYAKGMLSTTTSQPIAAVYEPPPLQSPQPADKGSQVELPDPDAEKKKAEFAAVVAQLRDEMKRSGSLAFAEKRIGKWNANQMRLFFGEPTRHRPSINSKTQKENGSIFAYPDPTRMYRELELRYDAVTKKLTDIYVYPWNMTWDDCKRLWGDTVETIKNPDGTRFYEYRNRRLSVFADKGGKVINFAVY